MNDLLKDVRWVTRIHVFAAIVIFVFAASPSDEENIALSLSELRQLRQIDYAAYQRFAYSLAAFREKDNFAQIEKKIRSKITGHNNVEPLTYFPLVYVEMPRDAASISEIAAFLSGPNRIQYLTIQNGPENTYSSIYEHASNRNDDLRLSGIRLSLQRDQMEREIGTNRYIWPQPFGRVNQGEVQASLIYGLDPHNVSLGIGEFHLWSVSEYSTQIATLWLVNEFPVQAEQLYADTNIPATVLPKSSAYLHLISDLSLGAAIRKMEEEHTKAKRNLNISGISIPGSFAQWGGPLALILLGLYSVAHVVGCRSALQTSEKVELEISWVALYDHFLPKSASFILNGILPVLASLMLSIRFWSEDIRLIILSMALLLFQCAILTWLTIELSRLRFILGITPLR